MDTDDILKAHEQRILGLEEATRRQEGLIAAAEDKASSAWKSINEVKDDVRKLNGEVEELGRNVKTVMDTQAATDKRIGKIETGMENIRQDNAEIKQDSKIAKSQQKYAILFLKIILILLAVLVAINIIFFVYIWHHNSDLAKELLTFGTSVVKKVS